MRLDNYIYAVLCIYKTLVLMLFCASLSVQIHNSAHIILIWNVFFFFHLLDLKDTYYK